MNNVLRNPLAYVLFVVLTAAIATTLSILLALTIAYALTRMKFPFINR